MMPRFALLLGTLGVLLALVLGTSAGCGLTNSSMEPNEVARVLEPEIDEGSVREHL